MEHHSTSTITKMVMMSGFELISDKFNVFFYLGFSVCFLSLSFKFIRINSRNTAHYLH